MAARTKARKRALDLVFEAEQRDRDLTGLLRDRLADSGAQSPLPEYAVALVEGMDAHRAEIDELLSTYAQGWTLPRMPAVDRAILRLGTFEVVWALDVPDPVAISEWVALATDLSTDESPKFVNGLLARIAEVKPTLN
ncbi:MAG: transcription antitermination factor NusB [Nostocoides sp.]